MNGTTGTSKKKVLIIDDDKINVLALAQFLRAHYEVIVTLNGADGLTEAKKQIPDIILLDVLMPDMTGFEVIENLKRDETTARIPVIFITGLDSEADEEKGLQLGAADYISKPFHRALVQTRVATHIQLAELLREKK